MEASRELKVVMHVVRACLSSGLCTCPAILASVTKPNTRTDTYAHVHNSRLNTGVPALHL